MRDDFGQLEEESIIPDYVEKGKENAGNLMQKVEKLVTLCVC